MKYVTGNLVTGDYKIFCHQVNCNGAMGAGIAKQIKDRYPEVYEEYKNYLKYRIDCFEDITSVHTVESSLYIYLNQ